MDANWEYARYQLEKIKKAIVQGIQRRPKRAKTVPSYFLDYSYPAMKEALAKEEDAALQCSTWNIQ